MDPVIVGTAAKWIGIGTGNIGRKHGDPVGWSRRTAAAATLYLIAVLADDTGGHASCSISRDDLVGVCIGNGSAECSADGDGVVGVAGDLAVYADVAGGSVDYLQVKAGPLVDAPAFSAVHKGCCGTAGGRAALRGKISFCPTEIDLTGGSGCGQHRRQLLMSSLADCAGRCCGPGWSVGPGSRYAVAVSVVALDVAVYI